jgi:hypothetical protein
MTRPDHATLGLNFADAALAAEPSDASSALMPYRSTRIAFACSDRLATPGRTLLRAQHPSRRSAMSINRLLTVGPPADAA